MQGLADLNTLERFDYWANSLQYMRSIAVYECDWASYNGVLAQVQAMTNVTEQVQAARAALLPARVALAQNATTLLWNHLARVTSFGDLGTTSNVLCVFALEQCCLYFMPSSTGRFLSEVFPWVA